MLASVSMSLHYIERVLQEAGEARPDQVFGCPVRYDPSRTGNDIFIHMNSDNSPLLDTLLEMADKGDLTEDWHLNVLGEDGTLEGVAWFTYDKNFPYAGDKWMISFTYFPELEESLPETNHESRGLRFGPGVKLQPVAPKEEGKVPF